MIAHVGGVPLEELLPVLSGAGGGLLLARGWIMLRVQRRRSLRVSQPARRTAERLDSYAKETA